MFQTTNLMRIPSYSFEPGSFRNEICFWMEAMKSVSVALARLRSASKTRHDEPGVVPTANASAPREAISVVFKDSTHSEEMPNCLTPSLWL